MTRWFRRRKPACVHHYGQDQTHIGSGAGTVCAWIGVCIKCGEETRELTPAGKQQVGWWMTGGLSPEEATAKVWAGEYPWEDAGGAA